MDLTVKDIISRQLFIAAASDLIREYRNKPFDYGDITAQFRNIARMSEGAAITYSRLSEHWERPQKLTSRGL